MNLKYKWYLRQDTLGMLLNIFSATFVVFMMMFIRYEKFLQYGLSMYDGIRFPQGGMTIIQALQYFNDNSIEPLAFYWLPIAIVVDLVIIRPLARKLTA